MKDKTYDEKYAKYYDMFNKGKDYSKECDFLEEIFKRYSKLSIKTILDLGCGTGLHDLELSKRGYEVTGLDLSKEMIEIAKKRGIETVIGDMSNFDLNEKFDAIICMFSAMGYLTKNDQVEGLFNCTKKHLIEKGLLVVDCWNGIGVMHEPPSIREKSVETEGLKIIRKSYPDLDLQNHLNKVNFNVKIFEKEKLIDEYDEAHKVRFFFPEELGKYMNDAGFEILKICPSYCLDKKVTEKDWNIVIVGQKYFDLKNNMYSK